MKNLENLNLQGLSIEEQRSIDGGIAPFVLLGAAALWLALGHSKAQ